MSFETTSIFSCQTADSHESKTSPLPRIYLHRLLSKNVEVCILQNKNKRHNLFVHDPPVVIVFLTINPMDNVTSGTSHGGD